MTAINAGTTGRTQKSKVGWGSRLSVTTRENAMAPATPQAVPSSVRRSASRTTLAARLRRLSPRAARMPISRLDSDTAAEIPAPRPIAASNRAIGARLVGQRPRSMPEGSGSVKETGGSLPLLHFAPGDPKGSVRGLVVQSHERRRVGKRQRTQKVRVDDTENRQTDRYAPYEQKQHHDACAAEPQKNAQHC